MCYIRVLKFEVYIVIIINACGKGQGKGYADSAVIYDRNTSILQATVSMVKNSHNSNM